MNKAEFIDYLVKKAKEYAPKAVESINTNRHMNDVSQMDFNFHQTYTDATIVDFINYIGRQQGMDVGLYTSDLKEELKQPVKNEVVSTGIMDYVKSDKPHIGEKLTKEDLPPLSAQSVLPIDKEDMLYEMFVKYHADMMNCYSTDIFDFDIDKFTATYLNTPIFRIRLLDAVKRIQSAKPVEEVNTNKISWTDITKEQPLCYEDGEWDGRRSDPVVVKDKDNNFYIVTRYHGILDGSVFSNYYTEDNIEITGIVGWMELSI